MIDSTTLFLQQIQRYRVLEHEEQIELIKLAQNGDLEAREKIINHNIRLVVSIAKKFKGKMEILDLIQVGTIGLYKAVDMFDTSTDYRFSTYAYFWVMQAINKEICDNSRVVRIPAYLSDLIPRVQKAIDRLEQSGKGVSVEDIAAELDERVSKVENAIKMNSEILSLDYDNDQESSFKNVLVQKGYDDPEEHFMDLAFKQGRSQAIHEALNTLNPDHKRVLILRFGLDEDGDKRTLKEVANIVGLTKERVRQIEKTSLDVLRNAGGRSNRRKKIKEYI